VRKAADANALHHGRRRRAEHRAQPVDPRGDGQADFLTGPLGSGHAMKALNNYVSAAGLVAAAEGVLPPSASGSTRETSWTFSTRRPGEQFDPQQISPVHLSRAFDSGFSLDLMVKDLNTALEVARSTGSPARLARACLRSLDRSQAALGRDWITPPSCDTGRRLAGTELGEKHD